MTAKVSPQSPARGEGTDRSDKRKRRERSGKSIERGARSIPKPGESMWEGEKQTDGERGEVVSFPSLGWVVGGIWRVITDVYLEYAKPGCFRCRRTRIAGNLKTEWLKAGRIFPTPKNKDIKEGKFWQLKWLRNSPHVAKGFTEATKETDGSVAVSPLREEQGITRSPESPDGRVKNRQAAKKGKQK